MKTKANKNISGMSLVELLVGILISGLVLQLGAIFVQSNVAFSKQISDKRELGEIKRHVGKLKDCTLTNQAACIDGDFVPVLDKNGNILVANPNDNGGVHTPFGTHVIRAICTHPGGVRNFTIEVANSNQSTLVWKPIQLEAPLYGCL